MNAACYNSIIKYQLVHDFLVYMNIIVSCETVTIISLNDYKRLTFDNIKI